MTKLLSIIIFTVLTKCCKNGETFNLSACIQHYRYYQLNSCGSIHY